MTLATRYTLLDFDGKPWTLNGAFALLKFVDEALPKEETQELQKAVLAWSKAAHPGDSVSLEIDGSAYLVIAGAEEQRHSDIVRLTVKVVEYVTKNAEQEDWSSAQLTLGNTEDENEDEDYDDREEDCVP